MPSASGSARPAPTLLHSIQDHATLLLGMLGVMWLVAVLNLLPFVHLNRYGIHPRSVAGLVGILFAPFLHAGFGHLILNTLPFLFLGGVVLLGGIRVFRRVTIFVTIVGGLGVWLFASSHTNHIGASGLIFGYLGFLLARGFFEKSLVWILIAVGILVFYGGLLLGVFPGQAGVSWQGHLFGFLSGLVAARLMFPPQKALLRG